MRPDVFRLARLAFLQKPDEDDGVIGQVFPTPGKSARTSMPKPRSAAAGPNPVRSKNAGE